jgi:DNA-binding transcriptional LysR family regulator
MAPKNMARTAEASKALVLNDLKALEIFASVVETQSVTKAAHRLGVTPSTVSKKLTELEACTGSRLLSRSTRRMSVTESGVLLYEHSIKILEEIEAAELAISGESTSPSGKVKVAAPAVFGVEHVAPHVASFLKKFPDIRLELDLSPQVTDMVESGTDAAVRIVSSHAMEANMRVICRNLRVLCAAPSYLAERGTPTRPDDLVKHRCLVTNRGMALDHWPLVLDGSIQRPRLSGPLTSDSSAVLRRATIDGLGISLLGLSLIADDLKQGRLCEVLPEAVVQESFIVAATAHRRFVPKRVMVFIEHLKAAIGETPTWERQRQGLP